MSLNTGAFRIRDKGEEKIDYNSDYNISEVDTSINYEQNILDIYEEKQKNEGFDEDNDIRDTYLPTYMETTELENISVLYNMGYKEISTQALLDNLYQNYIKEIEMDFDYISIKENRNIYILYNEDKEKINFDEIKDINYIKFKKEYEKVNKIQTELAEFLLENGLKNHDDLIIFIKKHKNNENRYKIKPFLQYKINKIKNKLKNKTLNKDLKFKLNGKEYTFSSNYIDKTVFNTKKEKKIYSKSNYFEKYKNRISDGDIKGLEEIIKNNESKNINFWNEYNKKKKESKDKINSLFKDDPVIDFNVELFYEKYKNKHYSCIYKDIIHELDKLEKDYKNIKIIETYYNKLKEDININTVFKNNNISTLFTDYENNRINEYNVLKEIGNLFVNNKLSKDEMKEINSMNQNSRPARLIKQSKRVYLLEVHVDIKNIALSGISNWLRDTCDNNFNILLSFFNKEINLSDSEIFPDVKINMPNFNINMDGMEFPSSDEE